MVHAAEEPKPDAVYTRVNSSAKLHGTRAAIYARSATMQEVEPSYATAAQIHDCMEYATQKGYQVADGQVYEEIGSGHARKLPGVETLLRAGKEGLFDILIVHSYDRLSRDSSYLAVLLATLEGYGIRIESVTEPSVGSEVEESMHFMLMRAHEQLERENIAKRTKLGKKRAREERAQKPQEE